jgi:hypothetical protein
LNWAAKVKQASSDLEMRSKKIKAAWSNRIVVASARCKALSHKILERSAKIFIYNLRHA